MPFLSQLLLDTGIHPRHPQRSPVQISDVILFPSFGCADHLQRIIDFPVPGERGSFM